MEKRQYSPASHGQNIQSLFQINCRIFRKIKITNRNKFEKINDEKNVKYTTIFCVFGFIKRALERRTLKTTRTIKRLWKVSSKELDKSQGHSKQSPFDAKNVEFLHRN